MSAVESLQLQDAWRQCMQHLHHMQHALSALAPSLPIKAATLPELDDEATAAVPVLQALLARIEPLATSAAGGASSRTPVPSGVG